MRFGARIEETPNQRSMNQEEEFWIIAINLLKTVITNNVVINYITLLVDLVIVIVLVLNLLPRSLS